MPTVNREREGDTGPTPAERVEQLEARLDAVAALAEKASATATEVAAAAKSRA